MNEKKLDLGKTVYELAHETPEIIEILRELGFENITNPLMMKTAGRVMTIPKGAAMKGMDLEKVKEAFRQKGFHIFNERLRE
jgi:hypothetical protein